MLPWLLLIDLCQPQRFSWIMTLGWCESSENNCEHRDPFCILALAFSPSSWQRQERRQQAQNIISILTKINSSSTASHVKTLISNQKLWNQKSVYKMKTQTVHQCFHMAKLYPRKRRYTLGARITGILQREQGRLKQSRRSEYKRKGRQYKTLLPVKNERPSVLGSAVTVTFLLPSSFCTAVFQL